MSDAEVEAKREAARRARRLARQFSREDDQRRAMAFAAELEKQADTLERAMRPQTTQMQMQVQQGPPVADGDAGKGKK